jgi:hypothetical protein
MGIAKITAKNRDDTNYHLMFVMYAVDVII